MNLNDLMTNVRLRLGDPRSNRPGDFQLLNAICTQIRTVKRHQRNTSNPWSFEDCLIDITPNEVVYRINQNDFGTPLAVLSWAPQLTSWIPRLIPFVQPQNMAFEWGLPNSGAAAYYPGDGSNCTVMRCAFYWRSNVPYIEILPVPLLQCQLKVRYLTSANGVNDSALTETLVSNEDADLCEVRAALSLLATTEWNSPDGNGRSYNAERRKDLSATLQGEEAELRRQFEAAQLITTGPRMTHRPSVADTSG